MSKRWFKWGCVLFLLVCSTLVHAARPLEPMPPTMVTKDFKLPDSHGEPHRLSSHLGRHVLVNFWTTECLPCRAELTTFEDMLELMEGYPIDVLAIHAGDDFEGVQQFLDVTPVSYPIVFDTELTLGHWGVPILPTTFIVDPEGRFVFRAQGSQIWNAPYMIDFLKGLIDNYEPYSEKDAL